MSDGPAPLAQRFAEAMGQALGPDFPEDIGLAVSGGGDSMAMLHLAADWARVWGVRLWVCTVDHGLRAESGEEARMVAAEAQARGLPHATLRWEGWDGRGNLQDAARRARQDLIGRWRGRLRHVLFAHTRDDQAETLLLRLRRGSGVEGLSGMAAVQRVHGAPTENDTVPGAPPRAQEPTPDWHIVRPLLEAERAELRHYNKVLRIPYADDPSNDDPRFDRVRIRALLTTLGQEGLDTARLSDTAQRLRRARVALGRRAHDAARASLVPCDDPGARGSVILERDTFAEIETDTQLRILSAALQFVASADYRPRESALEQAMDRWLSGATTTLHGCTMIAQAARLIVAREFAAVAGSTAPAEPQTPWDRRWAVFGPETRGLEVRALGEAGLAQAGPRDRAPLPRAALLAHPALWDGGELVACPAIGHGPTVRIDLHPPGGHFPDRLLSH
ncbi:tRNA lysidine(34) synthetase TilS [Oceaniglobus trochenteri]|uniref:tRNA lysidine(34) synthetase TilS n=1 Tax=Oceaniglobus trochenteri TaxID=2763260 RepID=UPI001CFF5B7C|nr:tRNA lysidine(34) synthetase TilS [Oceaniglobus trochenteri]